MWGWCDLAGPCLFRNRSRKHSAVLALLTDVGMAVATAAEASTAAEDGGRLKGCERNQERARERERSH